MQRTRGTYTRSELEAEMRELEGRFGMTSEVFFARWEAGELPHTDEFLRWAGLCGQLGTAG